MDDHVRAGLLEAAYDRVEVGLALALHSADFVARGAVVERIMCSPATHAKTVSVDAWDVQQLGVEAITTRDDLDNNLSVIDCRGTNTPQPRTVEARSVGTTLRGELR